MSLLEDLYDGNINPSERYVIKDSHFQKINAQLSVEIEKITKSLNPDQKQAFEKIIDDFTVIGYISEKESFIEGFRIGSQIALEIINFKSTNFLNP